MEPGTYTLSSIINEHKLRAAEDLEPQPEQPAPMYVPPLGELTEHNNQWQAPFQTIINSKKRAI